MNEGYYSTVQRMHPTYGTPTLLRKYHTYRNLPVSTLQTMIQVLSDILRSSARTRGSDLCWIRQQNHHNNGNSHSHSHSHSHSLYQQEEQDIPVALGLTYRSAVLRVHQHLGALRKALTRIAGTDITIAFIGSNSLDFALSILAASNLAVSKTTNSLPRVIRPALINTRWTLPEMKAALQPASSVLIVFGTGWQHTAERLQELLQQRQQQQDATEVATMSLPTFGVDNLVAVSKSHLLRTNSSHDNSLTDAQLFSDDAVIVFTSGTTSTAKGVRLSHRALLVQAAAKIAPPCAYSNNTLMLASTVPFFHVGGLSSLLAVWMAGGALVETSLETPGGGFSPLNVYKSLTHSFLPCNTLVVVPAMVHALEQQKTSINNLQHVDLILVGGQSLSSRQRKFLRQYFPVARIVQTFACTEAASSLTFWDVTNEGNMHKRQDDPPGVCVGKPPSHVQIQIFDEETCPESNSSITSPYQVGLIATRGPHLMTGYWDKPQPWKTEGAWYKLSDLGYWDESGHLYFSGRQTDTIRTGGETVWATEVEEILNQHNKVNEVAVIGLPDDRWGETVACAVVCHKLVVVTLGELRAWCTSKGLSSYKQPRRLMLLSCGLPRNASGKILKHRLKGCFENKPFSRL